MISKIKSIAGALGLTCVVLAGCVDEGGRYSNHRYAGRDNGYDFGYRDDEYRGRGRGSQHDGIGRAANDRVSQEYSGSGRERSDDSRSNNAGNSGSGQPGRGEVFTPPGG